MSTISQPTPYSRRPPAKDRRVRRSRRLLQEAMLSLIIERGYAAITISDLAEHADLNRATFYLHYGSKEELLIDSLETQFDALVAKTELGKRDNAPWDASMIDDLTHVFEYVAENAELFKALLGDNGIGYVSHRIMDYIAQVDEAQLRQVIPPDLELPMPLELMVRHVSGSFYANIAWWVTNDMPFPPRYMAEKVHHLCVHGMFSSLQPILEAYYAGEARG